MAAQRHEISLPVLKNISRASAPFERAYGKAGIRNPESGTGAGNGNGTGTGTGT